MSELTEPGRNVGLPLAVGVGESSPGSVSSPRYVPIICKGIGAGAVYVNTVTGMQWRCDRCGARVKVVA